VQTTHKISGDAAKGYAEYLTSTSSRGDYYTGAMGEGGGDGSGPVMPPSRWHGSEPMLADLGLEREAPVGRSELAAVMAGVSPRDGHELRRTGGDGTRVAAIDLTFSAPKSVSALWAVSSPYERARIEVAHGRAVAGAIARVERDVELVRTRREGKLEWQRAERLLAAEFVHTASRLARDPEQDGVPDPQLHSHVLVLGAERRDGRFAAVDSRELFRSARANGAWYRAELAYHLGQLGLEVSARTGRDGRYFELAGVPAALSERWSARTVEIDRAARAFRSRYGREPRGGELGALTVATRGSKAATAAVDVSAAWRAVAEEHGLSRERIEALYAERASTVEPATPAALPAELLADVVKERATVTERDLRARAYELAAGVMHPAEADRLVEGLVQDGNLIGLEGGVWTTRELREREQRMLAMAASRRELPSAPVSEPALRSARLAAQRELRAPLSREQREALATVTGRGGVAVLVGQAGTGKGVVIGAAAEAWRREGYEVIGTAVAGATAKRLSADAKLERTMTSDALLHRAGNGAVSLGDRSVVVMDEAGMADTQRLAGVVELTTRTESKLLLVGDQAQLPSIGAGGMFAELQRQVPTAELSEVHRAREGWEREAWQQLREGDSQRALAAYAARERLHIADTREHAAEQMVAAWAQARERDPARPTVMMTDASNVELDRINALAQRHRLEAGELGSDRAELPGRPYRLAPGDEVILTEALYSPGQQRAENGTLATVAEVRSETEITLDTREPDPREIPLDTSEFSGLRLAYAQHVYKAQGRTVDEAFVLIGGWQTDRERGYVALTRARDSTDVYVSREDLGEQGVDAVAIERLGEALAESHAQQASIATPERDGDEQEREREHEAEFRARESHDRDHGEEREPDSGMSMH
jgi:conjugative relaxase-like TrwC/TraI family protein